MLDFESFSSRWDPKTSILKGPALLHPGEFTQILQEEYRKGRCGRGCSSSSGHSYESSRPGVPASMRTSEMWLLSFAACRTACNWRRRKEQVTGPPRCSPRKYRGDILHKIPVSEVSNATLSSLFFSRASGRNQGYWSRAL